jgi:hypothetical protein
LLDSSRSFVGYLLTFCWVFRQKKHINHGRGSFLETWYSVVGHFHLTQGGRGHGS